MALSLSYIIIIIIIIIKGIFSYRNCNCCDSLVFIFVLIKWIKAINISKISGMENINGNRIKIRKNQTIWPLILLFSLLCLLQVIPPPPWKKTLTTAIQKFVQLSWWFWKGIKITFHPPPNSRYFMDLCIFSNVLINFFERLWQSFLKDRKKSCSSLSDDKPSLSYFTCIQWSHIEYILS